VESGSLVLTGGVSVLEEAVTIVGEQSTVATKSRTGPPFKPAHHIEGQRGDTSMHDPRYDQVRRSRGRGG
jgi:hypothetical protein